MRSVRERLKSEMPRIEAETVAAHRVLRHGQILDAAEAILLAHGYRGLTFSTLSERTGLARNTIYEYFASRDELIATLCERDLPVWTDRVRRAVAVESDPRAQLRAYVDAQLELVQEGRHRLALIVSEASLEPDARARIRAVHGSWLDLAASALRALGHQHPETGARLVQGLVDAATSLLEQGGEADEVRLEIHALLVRGV